MEKEFLGKVDEIYNLFRGKELNNKIINLKQEDSPKYKEKFDSFKNIILKNHIDCNQCPIVIFKNMSHDYNICILIHMGSNGKEGSIKNSLLKIATLMDNLQLETDLIDNVNLTDISCDVLDDVYDFALRIAFK